MGPPADRYEGEERRRTPVQITMSQDDLTHAIAVRDRDVFKIGLVTALVTALLASAISGFVLANVVTGTVRDDVNQAAVQNCTDTNAAARALETFLTSDAGYARQLGDLDTRSAALDADLSAQVRKLGPILPPRIAGDYQALGGVFQHLATLRRQTVELWTGIGAHHRGGSLAKDVLTAIHAHCDRIIVP